MDKTMQQAWETDDRAYMKNLIIRHRIREKWRKVCIANDEAGLPEYPRPLKAMTETRKRRSIISLMKYLIP